MAFGIDKGTTRTASSLSEINVTPLVDVMLVLLIIFMITAPMIQRGIDVSVPKTKAGNVIAAERLILTISKDNKVVAETGHSGKRIGLDEVTTTITDWFATKKIAKDQQAVYIRADSAVSYETLMFVIDKAKDAGVTAVGLITEPKNEDADSAKKGDKAK